MSAALLARLIAAGTPAELVAEVAMLSARADADREAIETRRANDRDRASRRRHVTSREITGDNVTTRDVTDEPSPSPSPSFPPDPQTNPTHTPTRGKTPRTCKGTRLSEDWQPDPISGPTADMLGRWPPGAIDREWEKFRNYWLAKSGKDAAKTNWQRTWINWLISADERIGKHGNDRSSRNYRHGAGDGFTEALQVAAGH